MTASAQPMSAMRSEAMPVGDGFTVTFLLAGGRLDAEWQPGLPGKKGRKLIPAYRRARDEFLRRVAHRHGFHIGVVEL